MEQIKIPAYAKYSLSIREASEYFGIGENKLRTIVENDPGNFVLNVGSHKRIKRQKMEKWLDNVGDI